MIWIKSNGTFCCVYLYCSILRRNQHGGRKYDDFDLVRLIHSNVVDLDLRHAVLTESGLGKFTLIRIDLDLRSRARSSTEFRWRQC